MEEETVITTKHVKFIHIVTKTKKIVKKKTPCSTCQPPEDDQEHSTLCALSKPRGSVVEKRCQKEMARLMHDGVDKTYDNIVRPIQSCTKRPRPVTCQNRNNLVKRFRKNQDNRTLVNDSIPRTSSSNQISFRSDLDILNSENVNNEYPNENIVEEGIKNPRFSQKSKEKLKKTVKRLRKDCRRKRKCDHHRKSIEVPRQSANVADNESVDFTSVKSVTNHNFNKYLDKRDKSKCSYYSDKKTSTGHFKTPDLVSISDRANSLLFQNQSRPSTSQKRNRTVEEPDVDCKCKNFTNRRDSSHIQIESSASTPELRSATPSLRRSSSSVEISSGKGNNNVMSCGHENVGENLANSIESDYDEVGYQGIFEKIFSFLTK